MKASFLSDSSRYVYSAIRESDDLVDELVRSGKKVVKLSSGDPALYFPTPKYVIEAYVDALKKGKTSYSRSQGVHELVDAIIERYKFRYDVNVRDEDILVTGGVAEGLTFLNSALINPNDTALILKPYYTQYPVAIRMFGGKFLEGKYDEANEWTIDLDAVKSAIRKSRVKAGAIKYILITNPNNPTGTVLSKKALEQVVELANEYRMLLISDEIYDEIIFRHEGFTSVAELAKGIPHVILNGASKAFDATGFRIGYMLVPENDRSSTELKRKLADYCRVRLSSNTPAQYAIAEAMSNRKEHDRAVSQMVASIEENVDSLMKLFDENPYLKTVRPGGAFYIFPRIDLRSMRFSNDREFVESLIREELIQTTRGSGFGAPNHFRVVALAPTDLMKDCAEKINSFCRKHTK